MAPLAPLPHQLLVAFDIGIGLGDAGEIGGTATRSCSAMRINRDPRLFRQIPLRGCDPSGFEICPRQFSEGIEGQRFFHAVSPFKANWSCEP